VHLFLWVSSVSADSLRWKFGKDGSWTCGYDEAMPGVFVSQSSPFMPTKLNTLVLLFSDLGALFLNEIFRFINCGARKAIFGHYRHIQHQAHLGLFQLYPTSLPCDCFRHVENLQDMS
jgi:hypothetical protein